MRIHSNLLLGLGLTLSACVGAGDPSVEARPDGLTTVSSLEDLCGGELAEDTFRYGLCVCDDLDLAGELTTASFRSSTGEAGSAGGVGINGNFSSAGDVSVDGALVVAGDLIPVGSYAVGGELRVGGDLIGAGDLIVENDAYVQDDLSMIGLEVGGTLHTTRDQSLFFVDAAANVVEDFAINAPCGCERAVDVSALVDDAAGDAAVSQIDDPDLGGFAGAADIELSAGRYFLDGAQAAGALRFSVSGPVELFVRGDLDVAGTLDVELVTEDATLDLFLDGDINTAGDLQIGDPERPAGVRVYLADGSDLNLAGRLDLDGALHAPGTELSAAGEVSLRGAVVVGGIAEAGRLEVLYDADLNDAGDACEVAPPAPAPEQPEEPAPEPAPEEGEPECAVSFDCPDPQICVDGTCVLFEG